MAGLRFSSLKSGTVSVDLKTTKHDAHLACLLLSGVLLLANQSAHAFTSPHLTNNQLSSFTKGYPLQPISVFMSTDEDTSEQTMYEYVPDDGARLATDQDDENVLPMPPPVPPTVDQQLEEDLQDAERRVMLYEKEVEMVREQLDLKQDELLEERNFFRQEKTGLLDKISEFTTLLASSEDNSKQKDDDIKSSKSNEGSLRKEVEALEQKLKAKQKDYDDERKATELLRNRMLSAEDALEYEQMEYQKQKQALQGSIDEEKKNLRSMEEKLKSSEETFKKTRQQLMDKIQEETGKLSSTKSKWVETQELLEAVQSKLKDSLKEKEDVLEQSKKELDAQRFQFGAERKELRQKIRDEQDKVKDSRQELEEEKGKFEKARTQLERALEKEQTVVSQLRQQMDRENEKFAKEKFNLEFRIKKETERLMAVEAELASERDDFSKQKTRLEYLLAEEVRIRKAKKKSMNRRYNEIRKEMTSLWEGAKRDGRREQDRLKRKYGKQLDASSARIAKLENQLDSSQKTGRDLQVMYDQLKVQKEKVEGEKQAMEARFLASLDQKDVIVDDLRANVDSLTTIVSEKEILIRDQRKKIRRYESSFRALGSLSVRVTGNKLKGAGRRIKNFVKNSPPPE